MRISQPGGAGVSGIAATLIAIGDVAAVGAGTDAARDDHQHGFAFPQLLQAVSTADETKNNDATLAPGVGMSVTVLANHNYHFMGMTRGTTVAGAGLAARLTMPSVQDLGGSVHSQMVDDTVNTNQLLLDGVSYNVVPITGTRQWTYEGLVKVGAVGGVLSLDWAQNALIVGNTTLHAGSGFALLDMGPNA